MELFNKLLSRRVWLAMRQGPYGHLIVQMQRCGLGHRTGKDGIEGQDGAYQFAVVHCASHRWAEVKAASHAYSAAPAPLSIIEPSE